MHSANRLEDEGVFPYYLIAYSRKKFQRKDNKVSSGTAHSFYSKTPLIGETMKTAQKAGDKAKDDKQKQREGFDNPLASPEMDLLGRRTLTQQVYSHLTNLEPEWSVRVGLLAPWGEGKTTVCDWIIKKAKSDGYIPVKYSPWAAKTDSELWHGFYTRLLQSFAENNLEFKTPKWRRGWGHMLSSVSHADALKKLSEANEIAKAGLEAVQSVFSMTQKDVKELVKQLPSGKRFIVIIDDLDRVESGLIPRLLLLLRDMMDVDCFSFLLPFDEEIISHALAQYGNSKEYGENFLEKILDYRVHIKPATKENVLALFKHEMEKYCPFIKVGILDSIAKLLPQNPRKLKGLVRSLRAYENEAKRHREGEIGWRALLFGQMIRIESESFFQAYMQDTFFRNGEINMFDTSGASPWLIAAMSDKKGEGDTIERQRIEGIFEKVGIPGVEKKSRLMALCEEMRKSYGFTGHNAVLYALKLVDNPELLTWGEFDTVWDTWVKTPQLDALLPWIEAHSKSMDISEAEVVRELLTTISQRYSELLDRASHVALSSEQATAIQQADAVLSLADEIISKGFEGVSTPEILTTDIFKKFLDVVFTWIHFDGNEADRKQRAKEKEMLKRWADIANKTVRAPEFGQMFNKMAIDVDRFEDKKDKLSAQLCDELRGKSDTNLTNAAIAALSEPDGIRKLMPYDAGVGVKGLLLNPSSVLWEPATKSKGLSVLSSAGQNGVVQKSALDFLDLIRTCANEGTYEMRLEESGAIFQSPALVKAIWDAAIATPLQFRRLHETRDVRKYLVLKGIDESFLTTPDWLMVNVDVDKKDSRAA